MEIRFQGKYDKDTFFRAVRLANQPTRRQGRFLAIMGTFALIAIGLLFFRVIESGDVTGSLILLLAAIALGAGVGWSYGRVFFTARKLWSNPGTRRSLQGTITNQGIRYVLDVGTNTIRWDRFIRVRRSQDFVVLVREDGLMVIFPRSFFQKGGDWRKFNRLVEQKVTKS
jgi:hypothetical protein